MVKEKNKTKKQEPHTMQHMFSHSEDCSWTTEPVVAAVPLIRLGMLVSLTTPISYACSFQNLIYDNRGIFEG